VSAIARWSWRLAAAVASLSVLAPAVARADEPPAPAPAVPSPPPSRGPSVAFEADALAYPLGGYSAILRISHESGLSYALGTGRYTLPTFLVKGQATYDEAGWKATSESIQVLRVGYRFSGPRKDGPSLDAIVLNQVWRLEATRLDGNAHMKTIGAGVSAGYWFHIGSHFYLYPNVAVTGNAVYSGETSVKGRAYDVPPVGFNGSLHVGWEL
jgi:hypothetical protein